MLYELFDDFLLERSDSGKLRLSDKLLKEDYIDFRNETIRKIELLQTADLPSFPELQILLSSPTNEKDISKKPFHLYVWAPRKSQSNASMYFSEGIDKKSVLFPEHRLLCAIHIAIALAETMSRINELGFRFGELSLDNISFPYGSRFNFNQDDIKFFCLDTLRECDPETAFTLDCDLLGRMLFLMITGTPYKSEYFASVHEKISSAPLIMSSYRNSNIYLVNRLYEIIRNLFSESASEKYTSFTQILSDLRKAEANLLFEKPSRSTGTPRPLDSTKATKESKLVSTAAIQNMLDCRPLYKYLPKETKELHVLAIGCGNYGQEFINQALQVGQMIDIKLKITAISDNPEIDHDNYLTNKASLQKFISINGKKINDPYAELNFEPVSDDNSSLTLTDTDKNQDIILKLAEKYMDASYVFIALGNDKLNRYVAEKYAQAADILGYKCCINYACSARDAGTGNAFAVNMNGKSSKHISRALSDMALKVHLSWSKIAEKDINTIRTEFENDPYSYNSSIANAISIRYKLHCLDIDYDYDKPETLVWAAEEFKRRVLDNDDKRSFNALVWLEHKRWNLEKLVTGWSVLPEKDFLSSCNRLSVKDSANKKHHCIVRSNLASVDNIWAEGAVLDDLDKVSVNVNKALAPKAEHSKKNWPEQEDSLAQIRNRINKKDDKNGLKSRTQYAYNRFVVAIKNVLGNSTEYAKRYDSYRKNLLSCCEMLGGKTFEDEISSLLMPVDEAIFPILECAKKTNYKLIDSFLISRIPYILTCPLAPSVAMGFSARSGNDELLGNVAATLALSSENLYYFYYYNQNSNFNYLIRKIRIVLNLLKEKQICCNISFFIAVDPSCSALTEKIKEKISEIANITFTVRSCRDEFDAHKKFKAFLSDKKVDFFNRSVAAHNDALLNDDLFQTLEYPCFTYSLDKNRVYGDRRCAYLGYIDTSDMHITTEDLLLLSNAKDSSFNFSELFNLAKPLWEKVCINQKTSDSQEKKNFNQCIRNWDSLCKRISRHIKEKDALGVIPVEKYQNKFKTDAQESIIRIELSLPSVCFKSVKKIVDEMKKEKIISNGWVMNQTSGICKIMVMPQKTDYADTLKKIFNAPLDRFTNPHMIFAGIVTESSLNDSEQVKTKSFVVSYDSLSVSGLDISANEEYGFTPDYRSLLIQLEENGFIRNLHFESGKEQTKAASLASFDFTSFGIKNVLKKEGELLENYIFYEAARTGYFDDVASGFEFTYEPWTKNELVKNEVDCIMTKGFKTIVVEAKARADIDQNTIHKLCNVANDIGVNTRKVLVITDHANNRNPLQFARGDLDEVIIIKGEKEILRIGEILKEIAEGNYITKEYI